MMPRQLRSSIAFVNLIVLSIRANVSATAWHVLTVTSRQQWLLVLWCNCETQTSLHHCMCMYKSCPQLQLYGRFVYPVSVVTPVPSPKHAPKLQCVGGIVGPNLYIRPAGLLSRPRQDHKPSATPSMMLCCGIGYKIQFQ